MWSLSLARIQLWDESLLNLLLIHGDRKQYSILYLALFILLKRNIKVIFYSFGNAGHLSSVEIQEANFFINKNNDHNFQI